MNLLRDLWHDECGQVFLTEVALALTISAGAVTVGAGMMAAATNSELEDLGLALVSLDQSYDLGSTGCYVDDPEQDRQALLKFERELAARIQGQRKADARRPDQKRPNQKVPPKKKRKKKTTN